MLSLLIALTNPSLACTPAGAEVVTFPAPGEEVAADTSLILRGINLEVDRGDAFVRLLRTPDGSTAPEDLGEVESERCWTLGSAGSACEYRVPPGTAVEGDRLELSVEDEEGEWYRESWPVGPALSPMAPAIPTVTLLDFEEGDGEGSDCNFSPFTDASLEITLDSYEPGTRIQLYRHGDPDELVGIHTYEEGQPIRTSFPGTDVCIVARTEGPDGTTSDESEVLCVDGETTDLLMSTRGCSTAPAGAPWGVLPLLAFGLFGRRRS